MVTERTPSSVTSGTNSSPNCVGSVMGDAGLERSVCKSIERGSESESSVVCNLLQSFTVVDDASQGDLRNAHLESIQDEEQEPYSSAELLEEDDVENHEVELKDIVGRFGVDDVGVKGEAGESMPVGRARKGMMFMSQKMKMNPKLKNFMKSTLTIVTDSKRGAELDDDESFEVSLNKKFDGNIESSEDRFDTTEVLETVDEFEVLKEDFASNVTDEDASSEVDASASAHAEAVLTGMSNDPLAFDFGDNDCFNSSDVLETKCEEPKVLESKCEESVELSLDHMHMQKSFECVDATDADNSTENELNISQTNSPPINQCFTSDGSEEEGSTSIGEGDGFKCNIFEVTNDFESLQAEFHDGETKPGDSQDDCENSAGPNAKFEAIGHDHSTADGKKTKDTEIPTDEIVGEKSGSKNDKYHSLKAKSWSEFVAGERNGAGGMKRLISRVSSSTERVRSFRPTKSFEPKGEEVTLQQDAQQDKDELASPKVVRNAAVEDDLDVNGSVISKKEGCASQVKSDQSDLDMSVFGRTRSETGRKSVATVVEKEEKPLEFLQMKVTLKFKALAGVSRVSSRRKGNSRNCIDDTVKAVATYRRNTIGSDRFVSTHVPSLPILTEKSSQSTAQVYAQWPGWQQKDDQSTASGTMMSSVTFTRTVRRVRNFDNVSSDGTAGGSKAKEPNEKDGKRFLASLSKAFAPELLDLQVGLMRGSNEIVPLGIATIVIPGEYKSMQLDIPVVRNYCTGGQVASKKKGLNISQFSGKAKSLQDDIYFSTDKETKYKIDEGAFLRLELNIEPALAASALSVPPRHLNANTHNATFRSGPINQALRRRRKMDHLMSLRKLPLHQRVQLYLELRSRNKGSNASKALPNSHEVCLTKQSEVSEVSCEVQPQSIGEEAGLLMDQFDMRTWASGLDTVEEVSKDGDSLYGLKGATVPSASTNTHNAYKQDETPSVATKHSNASAYLSAQEKESVSGAIIDTHMKDETKSLASQHSNGSDKISHQPEEQSVPSTSVNSFLANEDAGRLSSASHVSDHDDDMLSHFSSSLHSVFTTNHPQQHDIAHRMIDLMGCEPYLAMCEEERSALKYYAYEHEDTKCARHYCVPSAYDEFSDEDTAASLESVPINVNRTSDPFVVDA
eukprot:CAMPEP_0181118908 /NCGR_PEP_ID=MMETSP1071-20121207/23326_1 /TAXON_ID=35127 /ORGANISM="Thalassiosira sp., Strain NH16" /LENGTH=1133 /DNA_ID=CAMNT_0023203433 /DNA_START=105 /DNA_END=3506 /DNA_ORIENTATION=-